METAIMDQSTTTRPRRLNSRAHARRAGAERRCARTRSRLFLNESVAESVRWLTNETLLFPHSIGLLESFGRSVYPKPAAEHQQDADCSLNPETLTCVFCGVDHRGTCPACLGHGFHKADCPAMAECAGRRD